jgi:hypothetical protein
MSTSTNTVPHVYTAIHAVLSELSKLGITKDRRNEQGAGYNFRGIDDVLNALSPLLTAHKLLMLPRAVARNQEERQSKSGGALYYTDVRMEYDLISVVDGSTHVISMFGEAMDSSDKSTNKAESAAYKYAAFQAFCIPVQGLEDADYESPEAAGGGKTTTGNGSARKSNGNGTSGASTGITEASKKKLASFRATEAGEKACIAYLTYNKLVDFDGLNEKEAQEAIAWIHEEVKAATPKPAAR